MNISSRAAADSLHPLTLKVDLNSEALILVIEPHDEKMLVSVVTALTFRAGIDCSE